MVNFITNLYRMESLDCIKVFRCIGVSRNNEKNEIVDFSFFIYKYGEICILITKCKNSIV